MSALSEKINEEGEEGREEKAEHRVFRAVKLFGMIHGGGKRPLSLCQNAPTVQHKEEILM